MERSAFEGIDDRVALLDVRPIATASLWQNMLGSIDCGTGDGVILVHPSWWSPARVAMLTGAAQTALRGATIRPRSWLLARVSAGTPLIVEIADDFVVITGSEIVVASRRGDEVVETVVHAILATASESTEAVVLDAPAAVRGAGLLAATIAKRMPSARGIAVVVVDDLRLRTIAGELTSSTGHDRDRLRARRPWLAVLAVAAGVCVSVDAVRQHTLRRTVPDFPTTFAVEGHVAVEVPTEWQMRRVVTGPGSARLQFTSPRDDEVALHVTQSRVALPGLDATAEFLRGAIDAAPAGVFVDFNPVDRREGRLVVTYREMRPSHEIRWAVWVDKAVRISIGCQSRGDRVDAVGEVCALAVRSAHALN